jgi:Uncharacterized protein conserved in bacteria (DUF2130)
MNIEEKNINLQEGIAKILAKYKFSFECPYCQGEITEEHFNKGEKVFQFVSEKLRVMAENEVGSQWILHRRQWLKEVEETKKYEEFAGFLKLKFENEKQTKQIDKLRTDIQEKEKDHFLELSKITKQLNEKKQLETENLKKTIEELNIKLSGVYTSDKVEELSRVKELKKALEEAQKQNNLLKEKAQPEIEALRKTIEELRKNISDLQSYDGIEKLSRVVELKQKIDSYQKEIEELKERNRDLVISKNKDSQKKGEEFEQWFFEELVKVFDGRDNVKDISRGQIGSGKRADFLQEVLTETEPKKVVGRIIYETKNTEKWDNNWVNKLERDMQTHGAEFGFIVATCASDKIIKLVETIDPRKKIYVSDGDSNLFLVVKVVRELLINRYNFLKIDNETDKEQKLKKVEDWTNIKLPGYIMNLEKQFENQEKAVGTIIEKAEKLKKFKDEIYRITMNSVISELKTFLT